MTWLVVKFEPEDTVEAVPNTWYVKDKSQCYWPPENTAKNVIKDLIKKKRSPQANWILYGAIVLGCYDDYNFAQRKATKAIKKNTDNLSSNNENIKQKRSSKKKRKKGHKRVEHESEYELFSEAEKSSSDDSIYPQIRNKEADMVKNFEFTNQGNVYNKERVVENQSNNNNNSTIASTTSCATSTVKATLQHKSPLVLGHSYTKFETQVFKELAILSLKIDDISESLNVLIKNKADESQSLYTHNKVPDIVELY
ncbi:uncharacterized protein LOC143905246 [Temnothorax americanus]|uniref:uncharacterized protein LOC143905246 n=1 Tax=Temnothorax americanus TaxID=1964332 RepID=UPI0040698F9D